MLPRIAEHIDALTAGDESNAVIEALDAVNLMTVHAAKGLEFPIVFVVNMAKGASGPPKPIRVIDNGDDDPSVSVGPFVSDLDEADRDREKHETRRLLYVAFTRARDRLYLASTLKEGAFAAGRGSLGEVLPDSLKGLFVRAATAFEACETVAWTGVSGRSHEFRLCRTLAPAAIDAAAADSSVVRPDRLGPAIVADPPARTPVSAWSAEGQAGRFAPATSASTAAVVIVGRLVHRIFQDGSGLDDPERVRARAVSLLDADERVLTDVAPRLVDEAVAAWDVIRRRGDVRDLIESGEVFFEVPFSFVEPHDGRLLRGTIDCLVRGSDGRVSVIEFKTGRPRPAHQQQLDAYVAAARRLFPDSPVEGRLIYA